MFQIESFNYNRFEHHCQDFTALVALYTWCGTVFLTLKTLNKLDPIIEILHSSNKYSFVDHILFWRPPDMNVWDVETLMLALLKC